MKPSYLVLLLGAAALVTSMSSQASDHRKDAHSAARGANGMQAVSIASTEGQPGYGWRYFSDARERRAVVISPNGDYFYSHGSGLALVVKGRDAS